MRVQLALASLLVLATSPSLLAQDPAPGKPESPLLDHLMHAPRLFGDFGGARTDMEDFGVAADLYFNWFYGINTRGGANTNNAQQHSYSIDFFARADFERMGLIPGGTALMQVKSNKGKNINPDVGALSDPIDDADFDKAIYIDQLYYEQNLSEQKTRIRFGYLDYQTIVDRNKFANSEDTQFMATDLDNNPIVPRKIGFGATVWYDPNDWLGVIVGASDALNRIRLEGWQTAFDDPDDIMAQLEFTFRTKLESAKGELPGNYRVGGFYDPLSRPVYGSMRNERGVFGAWISADQLVMREDAESSQGLGVFARWGYRDARVFKTAHFLSAGVQYSGPLPGRDSDAAGLALWSQLASDKYKDNVDGTFKGETGIELYYRVQLTPWLAITPDLQYISDPGGKDTARDAVVVTLRTRFKF